MSSDTLKAVALGNDENGTPTVEYVAEQHQLLILTMPMSERFSYRACADATTGLIVDEEQNPVGFYILYPDRVRSAMVARGAPYGTTELEGIPLADYLRHLEDARKVKRRAPSEEDAVAYDAMDRIAERVDAVHADTIQPPPPIPFLSPRSPGRPADSGLRHKIPEKDWLN